MGSCASSEAEKTKQLQKRAAVDAIARSELLQLICDSPEPGCTVNARALESVRQVLGRVALRFELNEEDGEQLQLLFCNHVVPHESTPAAAGLCNKALFGVLGVGKVWAERVLKVNLLEAAKCNRVDEVRLVSKWAPERLDNDKELGHTSSPKDGWTALHKAAYSNSAEAMEVLLAAKASLDIEDLEGETALHKAAESNSTEAMELLLAAKASVDIKIKGKGNKFDKMGCTALHKAAYSNSAEAMELLLAAKASLDVRDLKGETALHKAAYNNSAEAMELLLAAKALVDIRDRYNSTALQCATQYKSTEAMALLRAAGAIL